MLGQLVLITEDRWMSSSSLNQDRQNLTEMDLSLDQTKVEEVLQYSIEQISYHIISYHIISIHPSIFYTHLIQLWGHVGAGADHWARGRVHLGQVTSLSQGHTETNETPINQTCMLLDTWREPTHTQGEHTNFTQKGASRELNLEPSCCEATTHLCSHSSHIKVV